jgi:RNA polymerase sigma-70 factor, ECF subfamily
VEQPSEPADPIQRNIADPDESLVAAARAGEAAAVTELYRRHERRVFNLALRMTNDPWDAADLTQDAFIKAFANLAGFKGDARFSTWLHRVATNVVYDHLRRRRADPIDDETLMHLASTQGGHTRTEAGTSWTSASAGRDSAADSTPGDPLSDDLREALLALPEGFRATIVLCDLLDFSYAESAQILQIAEGTVKSRLFRARAAVAAELRKRGNFSGRVPVTEDAASLRFSDTQEV